MEGLAYRQQELSLVTAALAGTEGERLFGAVKSVSQQGLFYAVAVDAGDESRFIVYSSTAGLREISVARTVVQASVARLREEVAKAPKIWEEGVFGGQSCTFVRVFLNGEHVDGIYLNLVAGASHSGVDEALGRLSVLIDEGTVIREEAAPPISIPEYPDSEIDEYVSKMSEDLFLELSDLR